MEALLHRSFKRQENKETTDPILEESMMYMVMVGVEVLSDMGQTNERVDALSLETSEGLAKAQLNINKVDRQFTELDHHTEVLEESCHHYQEFLLAHDQCQRTQDREIGVLRTRCDGLVWTD